MCSSDLDSLCVPTRCQSRSVMRRRMDRDWQRVGTHSESGRYAAEDWLMIYAEHLEKHSGQLERNLAAWKAR